MFNELVNNTKEAITLAKVNDIASFTYDHLSNDGEPDENGIDTVVLSDEDLSDIERPSGTSIGSNILRPENRLAMMDAMKYVAGLLLPDTSIRKSFSVTCTIKKNKVKFQASYMDDRVIDNTLKVQLSYYDL